MKPSKFIAVVLSSAVLATSSLAAAPLPAGKPAGSKDAALLGFSALTIAALGGFTALLIVAGAGGFSSGKSAPVNSVTTTATTGTSS